MAMNTLPHPTDSTTDLLKKQLLEEIPKSSRVDEQATYTYVGEAIPGTPETSPRWRITRITNADATALWADGNALSDNVWTNRASLSYS